jgi:hypothetical protein
LLADFLAVLAGLQPVAVTAIAPDNASAKASFLNLNFMLSSLFLVDIYIKRRN